MPMGRAGTGQEVAGRCVPGAARPRSVLPDELAAASPRCFGAHRTHTLSAFRDLGFPGNALSITQDRARNAQDLPEKITLRSEGSAERPGCCGRPARARREARRSSTHRPAYEPVHLDWPNTASSGGRPGGGTLGESGERREQAHRGHCHRPRHRAHRWLLRRSRDGPGFAAREPGAQAGPARQARPAGRQAGPGPEPVPFRGADRGDARDPGHRRVRGRDPGRPALVRADPRPYIPGPRRPALVCPGNHSYHVRHPDPG